MPAGLTMRHHGPADAATMIDELADVYRDARNGPEYDGPLWTREAFLDRTTSQVANPGFEAVTAHAGGYTVGMAFGLPFAAGRWWAGEGTTPPPQILETPRFAVIELNVRRAWQGRRISRPLLDELLSRRPEPMAMLLSSPGSLAWDMYQRWGWRKVSETAPPSGPRLDVLVLALRGPNKVG